MTEFYVDIEDKDNLQLLLRRLEYGGFARTRFMKELLDDLGDFGEAMIRAYQPEAQSGYMSAHTSQSGMIYSPGGRGGGGSFSKSVGIERGTSNHPLHVHFGTANPGGLSYRALFAVGGTGEMQGRIYPRGGRAAAIYSASEEGRAERQRIGPQQAWKQAQKLPVLTFQKRGEPRKFRPWVSGQRPRPFVYNAYRTTLMYASMRMRRTLNDLVRNYTQYR